MIVRNTIYIINAILIAVSLLALIAAEIEMPCIGCNQTSDSWFKRIRGYCNPTEIGVALKQDPPASGAASHAYAAACHALAGQIREAERILDGIPTSEQTMASQIVFEAVHWVSDAGDEVAPGAIMELTLKYQPNNYMALYHAGMAKYELSKSSVEDSTYKEEAVKYLEKFLTIFKADTNEPHRMQAEKVLARLR